MAKEKVKFKKMTKAQSEAIRALANGAWCSAYGIKQKHKINCTLSTLDSLVKLGVLNKVQESGSMFSPRTAIKYRLIPNFSDMVPFLTPKDEKQYYGEYNESGYQIFLKGEEEPVYSAGNNPHSSAVTDSLPMDDRDALPLGIIEKYCDKTGKEIAEENGGGWLGSSQIDEEDEPEQ